MSEPKSSAEIEDVLSSIRRLVSEDLRPAARQPDPPRPAARAAGDKLLLTPALRVVQDAATAAPQDGAPAAMAGDAADDAPQEAGFHSVRSAPAAEAVAALGAAMGRSGVQDEDGDEAPPAQGHGWEAGEAAFTHVEGDDDLDAPLSRVPDPVEAMEAWDAPDGTAAPSDAPLYEAEDWVPEAEAGDDRLDPHWQADEAEVIGSSAPQGSAPQGSWADAATAEVLRELSEEAEADAVFGRIEDAAGTVYDEELLRELVRDIIREELQGALGERITRNVRKLVRAEIARALAVRDFE
jgi:hypothetical protein